MHGGEVVEDGLAAVAVGAEALLQVDDVLGNPERVRHVVAHPGQALNTLLAGEPAGSTTVKTTGGNRLNFVIEGGHMMVYY